MPDALQQQKQDFRNTFGNECGIRVLGYILATGHYGETLDPDNKVQIAEYNFGLWIAHMTGRLDLVYPQLGIAIEARKE